MDKNNDIYELVANGFIKEDLNNVWSQLNAEYQNIESYIATLCDGVSNGISSWQGNAQDPIAAVLYGLEAEERIVWQKTYGYLQLIMAFILDSQKWELRNVKGICIQGKLDGKV